MAEICGSIGGTLLGKAIGATETAGAGPIRVSDDGGRTAIFASERDRPLSMERGFHKRMPRHAAPTPMFAAVQDNRPRKCRRIPSEKRFHQTIEGSLDTGNICR